MLAKGVTCSKDELDDLFKAKEPNDESYYENKIGKQDTHRLTKLWSALGAGIWVEGPFFYKLDKFSRHFP